MLANDQQCSSDPSGYRLMTDPDIFSGSLPSDIPLATLCVCPLMDSFRFLAKCRRRRLNQDLDVGLDFFLSVLNMACFVLGACFV